MSALDLPDKVWVKILGHLNVKSLLKVSETCSRFNDVIGTSEKLMKMIRLNIEFPANDYFRGFHHEQQKLKCYRQLQDLKDNLSMSQRVYQNSGLSELGRCRRFSDSCDPIEPNIVKDILKIFHLFCKNIINFKIQKCSFDNEVFMSIMDVFTNVQECSIENTKIYGDDEDDKDCTLKLPKLECIFLNSFKYSRIQNFFISCDNLKSCKIFNGDEFILKNLLLGSKDLKILHLECYEVFCHDVFSNPEIFLESLILKCDKWKKMNQAESFFKKQIHLQDISLKLSDYNKRLNSRYKSYLKQIFSSNHNLSTISIEIEFQMDNANFLDGICRKKVTSLSFESTKENSALFAALIKMCPKIKKLAIRSDIKYTGIAAVRTLVDLQSLTIETRGRSLRYIICTGRLLNLGFKNYGNDEDTKIFFSNHQSIELLIISNDIVSRVLCEHIVNYLPNLRSFEFDKLEYSSETLPMLLTLKNLRSLKSSSIEWINEVKDLCTSAGIEIKLRE